MALGAGALLGTSQAWALDKQGSAHGGDVGGKASGFDVSGAVTLGSSIYNPSYAARPDNTGLALMRYAAHADVDLIGQRLSIPLDVNMFTDKQLPGLEKLVPTELDLIGGVTTTWPAGPGAIEVGSRYESDRAIGPLGGDLPPPVGNTRQSYVDTRARYLYTLAKVLPGLAKALRDGDVSGHVTLGWFTYNQTYFARPNNTGLALFRYGLHAELSTFGDLVSVGIDATMFTDKLSSNVLRPSELDLTPEVILHRRDWELHVALETDRPLDAAGMGYTQTFLYALVVWSFDLAEVTTHPLESRGAVLSP